jgi:hypothetical protein
MRVAAAKATAEGKCFGKALKQIKISTGKK